MDEKTRTNLKGALFDTIRNQIANHRPKETGDAYERLIRDGYPHKEAMRMIALVLVKEMNDTMISGRPFHEDRYVRALRALPGKMR